MEYEGLDPSHIIVYLSFKPCFDKLKVSLQDTILSNKNYVADHGLIEIVDAEYTEEEV